jgi:hypothetical protein
MRQQKTLRVAAQHRTRRALEGMVSQTAPRRYCNATKRLLRRNAIQKTAITIN